MGLQRFKQQPTTYLHTDICMELLASMWVDEDPDMPVRASEVITMIQYTLCLIGNTPEFISQRRRVRILEKIDTS